MGLLEGASKDEIIKRYDVLLKKLKNESENKELNISDINKAYDALMGYESQVEVVELPSSRIWKMTGLDKKKVNNFFYYYKYHIIGIIVTILVLVYSLVSCFSRVTPDINIGVVGKIAITDNVKLESIINKNYGFKSAGVDTALDTNDAQFQSAIMQKQMLMFAAQDIDVFILDKFNFQKYGKSGAFYDLGKAKGIIKNNKFSQLALKLKIKDSKEPEKTFGLDFSNTNLFDKNVIYGKEFVISIGVRTQNIEKAISLLNKFLGGHKNVK